MLGDTTNAHQPVDTSCQSIDTISNGTSDKARGMHFGNNMFHILVGFWCVWCTRSMHANLLTCSMPYVNNIFHAVVAFGRAGVMDFGTPLRCAFGE